ncbi:MAG: hypothetical protein IK128_03985 [Clostridiales bacterium]|nr:hypothetical protein [Clostridiales bacterium]MBR5358355.1 hypothetical protein [Clostridiales bacterium]
MGFFDSFKENLEEANRRMRVHDEMMKAALEADKRRPGIASLEFRQIDPSTANDPRYRGYNKKTGADDFLNCIRSGRAGYAEVAVVTTCDVLVDTVYKTLSSDYDYIYRLYAKVADLNGTVYRETVMTAKDNNKSVWPHNFWDEGFTNPDTVQASSLGRAYVLHYYLQNSECYLLVDPGEFKDLSKVFYRLKNSKRAGCLVIDNDCNCWW